MPTAWDPIKLYWHRPQTPRGATSRGAPEGQGGEGAPKGARERREPTQASAPGDSEPTGGGERRGGEPREAQGAQEPPEGGRGASAPTGEEHREQSRNSKV